VIQGVFTHTSTLIVSFSKLAQAEGAIPVIKVALVCNDLAIANSSLGRYQQLTGAMSHISRGGQMYFARVSCGHLNEGMEAIDEIAKHAGLRAVVDECGTQARSAFADLSDCLRGGSQHKKFERLVGWIRNRVAFHYGPSDLRQALDRRAGASTGSMSSMTAGEDIQSTRFDFGDDLLDTIVCRELWRIPSDADASAEADRISDWCFQKTLRFLEFGEEFVPMFLRKNGVVQ
jgi:hypothetical protein